jgi:adenylate cyclase
MAFNLKANEERFWELIAERRRAGADAMRSAIDARIWDLYGEQRSIMFTDLAGFSRRVESFGIIEFLELILEQNELLLPIAAAHDGVLIKEEADSMMIVFRRPARALACARAMHAACVAANVGRPPEREILLCVGLGHGPILRIGDVDVYGEQVNAASKLGEDVARAHETLVTAAFVEALGEVDDARFEPLADERVQHAFKLAE